MHKATVKRHIKAKLVQVFIITEKKSQITLKKRIAKKASKNKFVSYKRILKKRYKKYHLWMVSVKQHLLTGSIIRRHTKAQNRNYFVVNLSEDIKTEKNTYLFSFHMNEKCFF